MLKVSRGDAGLRSPIGETLSPQRKRNRRSAAASDSLASLVMPTESNYSMIQPSSTSSSTRKKHSKYKHRATPSSLEQISRTAAATPVISAEKKSSTATAAAHFKRSNKKSASSKMKHGGKRSYKSVAASSSLLTAGMDKHHDSNNDNIHGSPQKKQHKKKRQISPRSKSKLESLVTQIPQGGETSHHKEQGKLKEHGVQQQKKTATTAKGSLVMVQPRTWPGMNKLGGVGRVIAVHSSTAYDLDSSQQQQNNYQKKGGSTSDVIDASTTVTYDVSYVLGGKDKNIEAEFVSLHDTNQEAPRERHQRVPITTIVAEKDKEERPKKKEAKKRKKVNLSERMRARASPSKKKEAMKKRNDPDINTNTRGKQLKQLHKVRDEQNSFKTAAEEEEEDPSASAIKSPAFSLSSQFSNQGGTFSPLDYLADSYPKIETPILEEYTEKWSGEQRQRQQQQLQQHQKQNPEEILGEERADDPSSSVVSTDEDGSEFTPTPQRRKRDSSIRNSRRNAKTDMSPLSENKSLELEYGRLALKKQEIERKLKMYKSDAQRINPWASTSVEQSEHLDTSGSASFGQTAPDRRDELERRSRNVTYGNTLQNPMTRYDNGMPSQEDVEFGEMVYRRNMAVRQRDRYSKPSKPKKKRRRRVVETITRVIHEESEDDGSSISDRQLLSDARYSDNRDYMSQN